MIGLNLPQVVSKYFLKSDRCASSYWLSPMVITASGFIAVTSAAVLGWMHLESLALHRSAMSPAAAMVYVLAGCALAAISGDSASVSTTPATVGKRRFTDVSLRGRGG